MEEKSENTSLYFSLSLSLLTMKDGWIFLSLFTLAVASMEDKSESTPPLPSYLRLPLYFSLCTKRIKETKKKAAAALAFCRIHRFLQPTPGMTDSDSDSDSDYDYDSDFFGPYGDFDDLLTVHPTELNIPLDFMNEDYYSCSIQLTNKSTDRIVAYTVWCSSRIDLVSPDSNEGTILPRSTSSVTLTVNLLGKEPRPEDKEYYIEIFAFVVKDGVKALKAEGKEYYIQLLHDLTDTETSGFYCMPVVYYYSTVVPAANPSSAVPPLPGMTSDSDSDFGPDSDFDALVTVHPTELKIPVDFNEEHYSCSIQLTNKTDRTVAYELEDSWGILLVSPDEYTYVGTILPRSTSSVTLTAVNLLGKMPPPEDKGCIYIGAYVVKDGVKAEDITIENILCLTDEQVGSFSMPVVYNYSTVVPAANPSSAVPDMANIPSSSRLPPDSSDENNDSLSEENINSGGKKKRTRGKTKVPVVAIGEKNRTMIEWNEYGQPVGKNSDGFSTTVGCLVRDNVPINIDNWHNVDKRIKESLWDLMMQKYVIEDCRKKFILSSMGKLWRNWKSSLSRSIREVEDDGVDVPRHIDSLKPNESTKLQWDEFVKSRTSDKFKELSQNKRTARAKQTMPYTLGRKGCARYEHELKIEKTCKSISRADLWIEGHKKRKGEKRGQPINDDAEKAIDIEVERDAADIEMASPARQEPSDDDWTSPEREKVTQSQHKGLEYGDEQEAIPSFGISEGDFSAVGEMIAELGGANAQSDYPLADEEREQPPEANQGAGTAVVIRQEVASGSAETIVADGESVPDVPPEQRVEVAVTGSALALAGAGKYKQFDAAHTADAPSSDATVIQQPEPAPGPVAAEAPVDTDQAGGSAPSQATGFGGDDLQQAPFPTTSSEDDEMAHDVIKTFYSILQKRLPRVLDRNAPFASVKTTAESQAGVLKTIPGYEEKANILQNVLSDLEGQVAKLREINQQSPTILFLEEDAALVATLEQEEATFQTSKDALVQELAELADQHDQFIAAGKARLTSKNKLASQIVEKRNQIARLQNEIANLEADLRMVASEEEDYTTQAAVMKTSLEQLKGQLAGLEENHARVTPFRDETARQEEARHRAIAKSEAEVVVVRAHIDRLCTP